VGSPELPVPAHGHHHQQVPQDGHQDDGGDEGQQHDLLRDAEALTRTGEHTKKDLKKKNRKETAAAREGDRCGAGTGARPAECGSSVPHPSQRGSLPTKASEHPAFVGKPSAPCPPAAGPQAETSGSTRGRPRLSGRRAPLLKVPSSSDPLDENVLVHLSSQ